MRRWSSGAAQGIACIIVAMLLLSLQDSLIKWLGATYALHQIVLIRSLIAAEPSSRFYVVVPINVPVPVDVGGAMGGIAVIDFESQEYLDRTSRERLATLLAWLAGAGVEASGEVVVGDPLATMQRIARTHPIDGIIII